MTTAHTPTPWNLNEVYIIDSEGYSIATTMFGDKASIEEDLANAAHIVKCVNLHDELVAALKAARDDYLSGFRFHEIPNETPYDEVLKKAGAL